LTVQDISTRSKYDLNRQVASLFGFQKYAFCAVMKTTNSLSPSHKNRMNKKEHFKVVLKVFLTHSFYLIDEILMLRKCHKFHVKLVVCMCVV
jgi:hypothetical protein